jgi:hypothetical protein
MELKKQTTDPEKLKENGKGFAWKSLLGLSVATASFLFCNTYLMATASGPYLQRLAASLGGPGALTGLALTAAIMLLLPPLFCWRKAKTGHALTWCLGWNLGLLIVTLSFGPVGWWMKRQGATPVALAIGEENWLVKTLLNEQLGWGMGNGLSPQGTLESEPFVQRWGEIVKALKSAESPTDLDSVVGKSNLDRVKTWPQKKQLLALRHVRNKIELLEFDAQKEQREWKLYDFDKGENSVVLYFRAYKKTGSPDDYLTQRVTLVQEDGQWKADFSSDIEEFKEVFEKR